MRITPARPYEPKHAGHRLPLGFSDEYPDCHCGVCRLDRADSAAYDNYKPRHLATT